MLLLHKKTESVSIHFESSNYFGKKNATQIDGSILHALSLEKISWVESGYFSGLCF